jgi:hypothetical protein
MDPQLGVAEKAVSRDEATRNRSQKKAKISKLGAIFSGISYPIHCFHIVHAKHSRLGILLPGTEAIRYTGNW